MKKTTTLLLALAVCLSAADFWQTKPYTEWSDKEVQKILTNCSWSKQVSVSLGESGGVAGKGGRRGATGEMDGTSTGMPGGGGNSNKNTGLQDVGGTGSGAPTMTVIVSWRTSLAVREAVAKEKFGAEAATSAEAKKMIDEEQKFYGVLVSGLPTRAVRVTDKMKESLLKNTSLIVKGRDPIPAADVQTGGNEQKAVVLFIFPKTSPLSADDKDVEFSTKFGSIVVRQKFHLKEMMFNGKLDL